MPYHFDDDFEDDDDLDGHDQDDDEEADDADDADDDDAALDDEDDDLDEDFPLGEGSADTSALVWCPYCGEESEIALDPGSGSVQSYVEDCPVCCRPWMVSVHFDESGVATVSADADDSVDGDL